MTGDGVAELRADLARSLAVSQWGEAAAVAVLLDFTPIAGDERFREHVYDNGVDWTGMLDQPWSSGERFLIATAAGLWTGVAHGADVSAVSRLGDDFYTAWQAMVTASRTGKVPA